MLVARRAMTAAALGAALCLFTGCTKETVTGDTTVYTYEWWVPLISLSIAVAFFALGVYLFRTSWWRGLIFVLVGVTFGVTMPLDHLTEKLEISPTGFKGREGGWYNPQYYEVKFADLARLELTSETRTSSKGRKTTTLYFICHKRDGSPAQKITLGDLWDGTMKGDDNPGAAGKVVEAAEAADVAFINNT